MFGWEIKRDKEKQTQKPISFEYYANEKQTNQRISSGVRWMHTMHCIGQQNGKDMQIPGHMLSLHLPDLK